MARDLSAEIIAAIAADTVRPVLLARIGTATASPGGDVRRWTGMGTLNWDDGEGYGVQEYLGIGNFGGVSPVEESADLQANGVTFQVSGVDSAMISIVLSQVRYGRPAVLWLGFLHLDTGALLGAYELFRGKTDTASIDDDGESSEVSITAENEMVDLERTSARRYTTEDQQLDDPTDLGFEYVPALQEAEFVIRR